MPSNWLYIDTNFPTFTGEESLKDQVTTIQNYMYMLVEQLRYTLHNLDLSNMNATAVDRFETALTEPIYIALEDEEERITQLSITAAGLSARMSDAEGNITTLQATSTGLAAQISNAEGEITALQATASGLSSTVANQQGQITNLQQTVNGFSLSASNGESSSWLYLMSSGIVMGSAQITFTGMVTFWDLQSSGATTINGDNITTGTILCSRIRLGGSMEVFQTVGGYILGGYLGYVTGYDYNGNMTSGMGMMTPNMANQIVVTTGGARMTTSQAEIVAATNVTLETGYAVRVLAGTFTSDVELIVTSDARRKEDIRYDITEKYGGLLERMKPASFYMKDKERRRHTGFIAQDLQAALEELGIPEEDFAALSDSDGTLGIAYSELIALLVAKYQELAQRVSSLEGPGEQSA